MPEAIGADSEPEVSMSAVKLDRNGNVVERLEFHNVEAKASDGFLADLRLAAKAGWDEGKSNRKKG